VVVQVALGDEWLRDGDDLVTVADVAAPLAALGTTIEIEHPDGAVEVDVPAGTQPGAVLAVKGKGMPSLRRGGRAGAFGDLRVVANVVIPRRLTAEQRELLERLAESVQHEQLHADGESMVGKLRRLFHR
jgi:molecular chaperone DnaJ